MNKQELLQELIQKVQMGEIRKEEVTLVMEQDNTSSVQIKSSVLHNPVTITRLLYVIGAIIVTIGLVVFLSQIWKDIGPGGRVLVTLGLGMLMAFLGSVLLVNKPKHMIGSIFHALGGVLIPSGAMVLLSEIDLNINSLWPIAIVFFAIFVFYLLLNLFHKRVILTFISVVMGTISAYLITASLTQGLVRSVLYDDIFVYLTMILGISYLLFAYVFREGWNSRLVGMLQFFGSIAVLGSAFNRIFESGIWEFVYTLIIIGGFFFSVYIKSRTILVVTTAFLTAYISYITGRYFADSFGWPLTLIVLGFVFIGLGYMSVSISKKYIA